MITIPGKISVTIRPFFWILCLLIGWLATHTPEGILKLTIVILISVLVHEYGHALTAVAFGQRAKIDLTGFGGVTSRSGKKLKPWQEFVIVLNGPLAGFCLYGISLFLQTKFAPNTLLYQLLGWSVEVNLLWTILNLLPIQPLDGGRIFSLILEMIFGFRGVKIALFLSTFFAAILAIWAYASSNIFMGIIFTFFGFESYRSWKESRMMSEADQDKKLRVLFNSAEMDLKHGDYQTALGKYSDILRHSNKGFLHVIATTRVAIILAGEGKMREAYEMLMPISKQLDGDGLHTLCQVAYTLEEWQTTADVGKKLFELHPSYQVARVNAIAQAKMMQAKAAVGWLKAAIREGLPNPEETLADPAFDGIRNDPLFQSL